MTKEAFLAAIEAVFSEWSRKCGGIDEHGVIKARLVEHVASCENDSKKWNELMEWLGVFVRDAFLVDQKLAHGYGMGDVLSFTRFMNQVLDIQ